MALNNSGQAAMTDALVLLFVVGILVTAIFSFSSNYGRTVDQYLSAQYGIDYTTSALKTLLYASVPKNVEGECTKGEAILKCLEHAVEVDYLLAAVKQDYSNTQSLQQSDPTALPHLSDSTKEVLRQNVSAIMQNVSSSYDYMFSIQETQDQKNYVFMYLYVTNFKQATVETRSGSESFNCGTDVRGNLIPSTSQKSHVEYYCTAKNSLNVQSLVSKVGDVSQAFAGITLARAQGSSVIPVNARAELKMWVSTCLPASVMFVDSKDVSKGLSKIDWMKAETPWNLDGQGNGLIVCQEVASTK